MNWLARLLVACLPLLAGCDSECKARDGSYVATYSERSGNCGELGEVTVGPDDVVPGCGPSKLEASDDNCETEMTSDCVSSDGLTLKSVGGVDWNQEGTSGSGTFEFRFYDQAGAPICQGTYDITFEKL